MSSFLPKSKQQNDKKISIKILLSNALAGSLIGSGGRAIKELMSESGARISVSSNTELYPGTSDRIVLINGTYASVTMAITLVWEMLALISGAESAKDVEWSPSAIISMLGQNDENDVSCKLTIPAATGGLILGRGGANIRSINDESGATVVMSGKDEALFTQERIITISGQTSRCIKASDLLVSKLMEGDEIIPYIYRGTSYTNSPSFALGLPYNPVSNNRRNRGNKDTAADDNNVVGATETTITLSVPDELVGNILGKGGAIMREIISLSGAKVSISARGEYVENTTNRLVTITGTSVGAQRAHLFITQRLQSQADKKPAR